MNRMIPGVFWIALFLAVVLLPVTEMLVSPVPSGRPFWLEASVGLGFFGLTQIAVQFVLIARFKSVTAPYGIDVILQFHRQLAIIAIAVLVFHPLIIVIDNPSRLKLLNPLGGNWASRCALVSLLALLAIAATSIYRERLRLNYEHWRLSHLLLGVVAVVFAQLHVSLAGLYTNNGWKQAIWVGMAVAMVGAVLYLRVLKPAWQRGNRWRVTEVRAERGDTWTLVLEPVEHPGLAFLPGQFAWLKLAGSPFTLEEHPFSFSSSAQRQDRVEFSIKALGDFTSTIKDVPVGTLASLDGPHGAFCIDRYPAVGYLFIAGGVGITPMMSFMHTMADRRDPRPVLLLYADRDWGGVAFREELAGLQDQLDLQVVYVLQEPPGDWQGEQGMITPELLRKHLPKELILRNFFICGPPPMMEAVQTALLEMGVRQEFIHMERFNLA
ncbi:MAG: ferric reductase-like transmembrane domain-containing protein [Desulfuromonadales bacterium]|nr:ferric reductase-like transmembrane domain-containing protein [Desulfuromonadales bacterium]